MKRTLMPWERQAGAGAYGSPFGGPGAAPGSGTATATPTAGEPGPGVGWVGSGQYPTDLTRRMRDTMRASPESLAAELAWRDPTPNTALGLAVGEGRRLRDEGESRRLQAMDWMKGSLAKADVPTLSDADVRNEFSAEADAIAGGAMQDMSNIRQYLGQSGITGGGFAGGLAAQAELERMRQITGAKLNLKIKKAASDALDRANRFSREQAMVPLINEDPNTTWLDTLGELTGVRTAQDLGQKQLDAANAGAKASRQAGLVSAGSSVLSSIIASV